MVLKLLVDSLEDVSEEFRGEYKEVDGKFLLQTEPGGGFSVEKGDYLRTEIAKAQDKHRKATEKLGKFDDLDPEAARAALLKVADIGSMTPTDEVQATIDAHVKQITEKHDREVAAGNEVTVGLEAQIEELVVDQALRTALIKHGAGKSLELLLPAIKANIMVEKNANGKPVARIKSREGIPEVTKRTNSTEPMDIDEYVELRRSDPIYAPNFEGSGASGVGSKTVEAESKPGSTKTVPANDPVAIGQNLEKIASGDVVVTMPSPT